MKTILKTIAIAGLTASLAACALLSSVPVLGETASDSTRSYAKVVFQGFKIVWIPALDAYHHLKCDGKPAPCHNELYNKLYAATDAATACMVSSTEPGVLLIKVQECLGKVTEAKTAFTQQGLAPKEPTP